MALRFVTFCQKFEKVHFHCILQLSVCFKSTKFLYQKLDIGLKKIAKSTPFSNLDILLCSCESWSEKINQNIEQYFLIHLLMLDSFKFNFISFQIHLFVLKTFLTMQSVMIVDRPSFGEFMRISLEKW